MVAYRYTVSVYHNNFNFITANNYYNLAMQEGYDWRRLYNFAYYAVPVNLNF
ncbi:hypothetical protein FACS189429_5280 [Bacteroidia bacterium]|nr:hypothetical protein FACS189429_5280 [Bacteroidia bacterium]